MHRRQLILTATAFSLGLPHRIAFARSPAAPLRRIELVTTVTVAAPRPGTRLHLPLLLEDSPRQHLGDLRWLVPGGRADLLAAAGDSPALLVFGLPETTEARPVLLAQIVTLAAPPLGASTGPLPDLEIFRRATALFPVTADTIACARRFTAGSRDDAGRLHALRLRLHGRGEPAATARRLGFMPAHPGPAQARDMVMRDLATRLEVALARAVGIPARAAQGLALDAHGRALGRGPEWRAEAWHPLGGWQPIEPAQAKAPQWIAFGSANEAASSGFETDVAPRLELPGSPPRPLPQAAIAYATRAIGHAA